MVFFTCNHCGESLKKGAVEKHYQWKSCRNAPIFVTCVDCLKDFRAQEYVAHTKCISEAERYSAKGQFIAKPDKNKGAQKQEIWTECLDELSSKPHLDSHVRDILQRIAAQTNVPRKKPKFINFLKSSMRFNVSRAEQIWKIIEEGLEDFKKRAAPPAQPRKSTSTAEATNETNGTEESVTSTTTEEHSNGVNGTTKSSTDVNSVEQIQAVLKYALQQPDVEKPIRKILKTLLTHDDIPLNIKKPKHKKFVTYIVNKLILDTEVAEQIWTIVASAASVIEEEITINEAKANASPVENGNSKKRKTIDTDDVSAKRSKSETAETNDDTNGNDDTFDWTKTILRIFDKNSSDNALDLATLQSKVVKRYAKHIGDDGDAVTAQYAKKTKKQLKKIDRLIIENGLVKLKV